MVELLHNFHSKITRNIFISKKITQKGDFLFFSGLVDGVVDRFLTLIFLSLFFHKKPLFYLLFSKKHKNKKMAR